METGSEVQAYFLLTYFFCEHSSEICENRLTNTHIRNEMKIITERPDKLSNSDLHRIVDV